MNKNPFSLYDFLGYLFPGLLTILIIFYMKSIIDTTEVEDFISFSKFMNTFTNGTNLQWWKSTMVLIVLSYVLGHIIAYFSSVSIEYFANKNFKYPSYYLLNNENRKYKDYLKTYFFDEVQFEKYRLVRTTVFFKIEKIRERKGYGKLLWRIILFIGLFPITGFFFSLGIFTGLNNLKVLSVTSVRFDEYFGFTDQEVRRMLEYYGLSGKYDTVKQWYDGYRFGNVDVYCPWDVISYCDELTDDPSAGPKDYWSNTSSNDVVRRLLEKSTAAMRDDIERLISGESVTKEVNEELTYNDLYSRAENVWSVLFTTGYLTQRGKADGEFRRLAIPNREIQNIFMNQIREWMPDAGKQWSR